MSKEGGKWARPGGFTHKIWIPDGADYDPTLPEHYLEFCASLLRFPTGFRAGQPMEWMDWQRDLIIRPTWGLRWEAGPREGLRVIRKRFFLSGRGTAKSTGAGTEGLWAPNALPPAEVDVDLYAVSAEQAALLYEIIVKIINASPALDEDYTIHHHGRRVKYECEGKRGTISVRTGDAKAELGLNPDVAFMDELLAQKNRHLYDAVATSFGKKPEGLFGMMTTPDVTVHSFARQEYQYAKRVVADRSLNPTYLPVIFEADPQDDPFDRKTWIKAAPGLGVFQDEGEYVEWAERARDNPLALQPFKVYKLALWADAGTGFINMESWADNVAKFPKKGRLKKMPCFFGLDMSTAHDMTSLCILWWDAKNDTCWTAWRHWSTEKMTAEMDEVTGGRWKIWRDDPAANLRLCEGSWIEIKEVADEVIAEAAKWKPVWVGIDTWRGSEVKRYLGEDGADLPLQTLHSGGKQMQAATERVEGMVRAGRLKHTGDLIAAWCAQNAEVSHDRDGYPKLQKMDGNRRLRIDAIAALCMATDRMLAWEREEEPEPTHRIWLPLDDEDPQPEAEPSERVLVW